MGLLCFLFSTLFFRHGQKKKWNWMNKTRDISKTIRDPVENGFSSSPSWSGIGVKRRKITGAKEDKKNLFALSFFFCGKLKPVWTANPLVFRLCTATVLGGFQNCLETRSIRIRKNVNRRIFSLYVTNMALADGNMETERFKMQKLGYLKIWNFPFHSENDKWMTT